MFNLCMLDNAAHECALLGKLMPCFALLPSIFEGHWHCSVPPYSHQYLIQTACCLESPVINIAKTFSQVLHKF